MANNYLSLHFHVVFSTKHRERWITPEIESEVWAYLGGICRAHGVKALMIGGVEDHIHLLVGMPATVLLCDLVKRIKGESSKWISTKWPAMKAFSWQDGYGGFSIGHSQIRDTVHYISHQREHHRKFSFEQEYRRFVEVHGLPLDEKYLLG